MVGLDWQGWDWQGLARNARARDCRKLVSDRTLSSHFLPNCKKRQMRSFEPLLHHGVGMVVPMVYEQLPISRPLLTKFFVISYEFLRGCRFTVEPSGFHKAIDEVSFPARPVQ